jgi:NAD(P)H dehydrogenase (quinone)
MPERNPILITGAAGEIGGVSRTMVDMLRQLPGTEVNAA